MRKSAAMVEHLVYANALDRSDGVAIREHAEGD
jgi:hypothetical protein